MGTDPFDVITSSLDPAMAIVTATFEGEHVGCLVGFHAQSSIEPKRYSVWISKANHTYGIATRAPRLGIHFLTTRDDDVAAHFGTETGDEVDKFAGVDFELVDDTPLLARLPNRLLVRRISAFDDLGDHVCLTTESLRAHSDGPFDPLRLSDVSALEPGHSSDGRATT